MDNIKIQDSEMFVFLDTKNNVYTYHNNVTSERSCS